MKKITALLLAVCLIVCLAACGGKDSAEPVEEYCSSCTKEQLSELIKDPDPAVRAKAARSCSRFEDLDFLPALEEILSGPNESGLHAAALKALADLWYDAPDYVNIHEEAYFILTDYLQHEAGKPLPDIEAYAPFTEKVEEKWLLTANFFDRDALVQELEVILADPACEGEYREVLESAVKILNAIQASLPGSCNLSW